MSNSFKDPITLFGKYTSTLPRFIFKQSALDANISRWCQIEVCSRYMAASICGTVKPSGLSFRISFSKLCAYSPFSEADNDKYLSFSNIGGKTIDVILIIQTIRWVINKSDYPHTHSNVNMLLFS